MRLELKRDFVDVCKGYKIYGINTSELKDKFDLKQNSNNS